MKNFLKTIFSAMKTWVGIKVKDSTADWNQNDPSATNYVKNRPFYEKEGIVYKLDKKYLPEECATLEQVGQVAEMLQVAVEEVQNTTYEVQDIAETAKSTAETAQSTAETAQSTADSKMDKTNPSGTGSFSMNGMAKGDNSTTFGLGTVAAGSNRHVIGEYNKNIAVYTVDLTPYYSGYILFRKTANFYHAKEYTFNPETGIYTLISPTLISGETLRYTSVSTLLGEWFVESGNEIAPDEVSGTRLIGVIQNYYVSSREPNVSTNFGTHNNYCYKMSKYCYLSKDRTTSERGLYAHIVGNGTSESERSNAHTLDWDGNAWYQGEVYVGGTSQDDENAVKLAKVTDIPEAIEQWMTENPIQAEVPEALPNPNKLTFTGAVTAEYDGSEEIAIEIPEIPEIPESIPVPETAEVGQTIVVKAVDENGQPTEWEAVDIEKKTKLITVLDVTLEQDTILSHDDTNDLSFGDAVIAGSHYFYKTLEGNQLKAKRIYGYIQPPSELKLPTNLTISPYYADGTPNGWSFGDFLGNYVGIIGLCDGNITIAANNYFTFAVSHDLKIAYSGAGGSLNWLTGSNRKMAYKTMDATFPYFSGVKIALVYGSFTIPAGTKIVIKAEVEDNA